MTQILNPLPSQCDRCLLCGYVNTTSLVQIIRIANIPNWYFERVIFPRQRLLFEALPQAQLEIYTGEFPSSILWDRILCKCLRVIS